MSTDVFLEWALNVLPPDGSRTKTLMAARQMMDDEAAALGIVGMQGAASRDERAQVLAAGAREIVDEPFELTAADVEWLTKALDDILAPF